MKFQQTEIGKIPEDWEIKELRETVSKLGDGLHGTPKYDNNGDYYFINGNNLIDGKIILDEKTKKCSQEEFEKYKKELSNRTILVSINGTLGNIALYNDERIILGKSVCYLNVKEEFSILYIKYILKNRYFQNFIQFNATGTTIKNVSLKQMREFKFGMPKDYKEQLSIASILSSLDAKIELNNKMNKTLEAIGQAIFKKWFVDEKFNEKELGEILSLEYGTGLNKDKRNKGKFPIYGSGGIMGFHNEYLVKGPGIIVGRAGCPGKIHLVNENFWPIDSTFYVNTKGEYFFYVYYLLKMMKLEFLNSGSAVPGLNRNTAYQQKINFPREIKIKEFNNLCKVLFLQIWKNEEQSHTLSLIRDALLPKLMSGEIRVK